MGNLSESYKKQGKCYGDSGLNSAEMQAMSFCIPNWAVPGPETVRFAPPNGLS